MRQHIMPIKLIPFQQIFDRNKHVDPKSQRWTFTNKHTAEFTRVFENKLLGAQSR